MPSRRTHHRRDVSKSARKMKYAETSSSESDATASSETEQESSDEEFVFAFAGLTRRQILQGGRFTWDPQAKAIIVRHALGSDHPYTAHSLPGVPQLIDLARALGLPFDAGKRVASICLTKLVDAICNTVSASSLRLLVDETFEGTTWTVRVSAALINSARDGEFEMRMIKDGSLEEEHVKMGRTYRKLVGGGNGQKTALVKQCMTHLVKTGAFKKVNARKNTTLALPTYQSPQLPSVSRYVDLMTPKRPSSGKAGTPSNSFTSKSTASYTPISGPIIKNELAPSDASHQTGSDSDDHFDQQQQSLKEFLAAESAKRKSKSKSKVSIASSTGKVKVTKPTTPTPTPASKAASLATTAASASKLASQLSEMGFDDAEVDAIVARKIKAETPAPTTAADPETSPPASASAPSPATTTSDLSSSSSDEDEDDEAAQKLAFEQFKRRLERLQNKKSRAEAKGKEFKHRKALREAIKFQGTVDDDFVSGRDYAGFLAACKMQSEETEA